MLCLLLLFHAYVWKAKIFISLAFKSYRLEAYASILPRHQSSLSSLEGLNMLK